MCTRIGDRGIALLFTIYVNIYRIHIIILNELKAVNRRASPVTVFRP